MERESYEDNNDVEREIEEGDGEENENEERPRNRAEAVYGDTDMDPNRDDQRSAHHAESDEHL